MAYKTLEKLFYADLSSDRYACHDELLRERLAADGTVRTGIHPEHGELFACVPLNLSVASERILKKSGKSFQPVEQLALCGFGGLDSFAGA